MSVDEVRAALQQAQDVSLPADMNRQGHSAAQSASVTPLRAGGDQLRPRAKALLAAAVWSGDFEASVDRDYLVKGWLDRGAVSVIYGPSNVGKSFFALDLAHHIAKGLQWGGRRVNAGRVLYLAAEGGTTFANRVAALQDPAFWVLQVPLTLTGKDSAAAALSEMMQHLAATGGGKFDLIILDTLSRVMGGNDENAAPDIADLVHNLDHIRRGTGAHVLIVHHTGKDAGRGARGHSSLRAAIDTEIELSRDDETGIITAEVTKQRDGPTGYRFAYCLRQVELGRDSDGDPVTTCLVEPTDSAQAGRAVLSDAAQKAVGILDKMVAEGGEVIRHPSYPGTPCAPLADWREACLIEGAVSSAKDRDGRGKTFLRVRSDLEAAHIILIRDERVWKVQHE